MKAKTFAVLAAGAMLLSAQGEYVFDQSATGSTGGGLTTGRTWTELSNAFTLGLWVKNVTTEWGMYYADMGSVTLYHAWSADTTTWPRDNVFYYAKMADPVGGTNVAVHLKVPTTAYCRYKKTTDQPTAVDGKWHHLVITFNYDADNAANRFMRFYVDGVLGAESTDVYGPIVKPTKNLVFGGNTDGSWGSRTLRQAEVTLWNRALSSSEIATLATRRARGNESGLIGYWPLSNPTTYELNNCVNGGKGCVTAKMTGFIAGGSKKMVWDDGFTLTNSYCVVSPAWAKANGYVQPADASFRSWSDPATNIQDAADVAGDGSTLLVRPGTYLLDRTLCVSNWYMTVRSCDPDNGGATDRDGTVLDGQGKVRVVYARYGNSQKNRIEIDGFTIRNGYVKNDSGGGAHLSGSCSGMGNLHLRGRFVNCLFTNNVADVGSSSSRGGGALNMPGGYVSNCVFIANYSGCNGGAIRLYGSDRGSMTGETVRNNYLDGTPAAYNCAFTNNIAATFGGACADNVSFTYYAYVLEDCDFYGNMVSNSVSAGRYGHHVALPKCSYVARCKFHAPGKNSRGGSLYGSLLSFSTYDTFLDCLFENGSGSGFGSVTSAGASATFERCIIRNCSNDYYGNGAMHLNGSVTFRSCLFADNSTSAIYHQGGDNSYYNCTFANNSRFGINLGEYHTTSTSRDRLYNCIFSGNGVGAVYNSWSAAGTIAEVAITNACLQSAIAETTYTKVGGNVFVGKPGFTDAAAKDYSLRATSRCRERGEVYDWMTSDATDLGGQPRLVNRRGVANAPNALPDLGCYEQQSPVPATCAIYLK